MMVKERKVFLILYNLRSAQNVGSIFRTADAAGVSKIYLVGYTPAPFDRFGRTRKDFTKASLGAEKTVPWEQVDDIKNLIEEFKNENFQIVALEQSPNSIDYRKYKPKSNFALIVGNEVEGVPEEILKLCDKIIEIPMHGTKESLNVSVAVGVILYGLLE